MQIYFAIYNEAPSTNPIDAISFTTTDIQSRDPELHPVVMECRRCFGHRSHKQRFRYGNNTFYSEFHEQADTYTTLSQSLITNGGRLIWPTVISGRRMSQRDKVAADAILTKVKEGRLAPVISPETERSQALVSRHTDDLVEFEGQLWRRCQEPFLLLTRYQGTYVMLIRSQPLRFDDVVDQRLALRPADAHLDPAFSVLDYKKTLQWLDGYQDGRRHIKRHSDVRILQESVFKFDRAREASERLKHMLLDYFEKKAPATFVPVTAHIEILKHDHNLTHNGSALHIQKIILSMVDDKLREDFLTYFRRTDDLVTRLEEAQRKTASHSTNNRQRNHIAR